jgi:hypothetical protein
MLIASKCTYLCMYLHKCTPAFYQCIHAIMKRQEKRLSFRSNCLRVASASQSYITLEWHFFLSSMLRRLVTRTSKAVHLPTCRVAKLSTILKQSSTPSTTALLSHGGTHASILRTTTLLPYGRAHAPTAMAS